MLYHLIILIGLLALVPAFACLVAEQNQRKQRNKEMLHTAFTVYGRRTTDGREYEADLWCTDNLIGRRKRKCNLCVDFLNDNAIAKVHARLWLHGGYFCIAPVAKGWFPGRITYHNIFVNGYPVPKEGMVLYPGDLIRMGNSEFYLKNTKE